MVRLAAAARRTYATSCDVLLTAPSVSTTTRLWNVSSACEARRRTAPRGPLDGSVCVYANEGAVRVSAGAVQVSAGAVRVLAGGAAVRVLAGGGGGGAEEA
eukprot:7384387-Prymnesium_polylepis.1